MPIVQGKSGAPPSIPLAKNTNDPIAPRTVPSMIILLSALLMLVLPSWPYATVQIPAFSSDRRRIFPVLLR